VSGRPAAFLDRDGTLNELVPDPTSGLPESPLCAADVRLIEGAAGAARALARAGFALVCVSNQPAAAKGKVPLERLLAVHERVLALLREEGVHLDASHLCLHHPEGVVAKLTGPCDCRKPAPGMLLDAAEELGLDLASSWIVGDTDADIAAGSAVGCRTLLIHHPGSVHKRLQAVNPDAIAHSLAGGITKIGLPRSETNR
jgi:D-glycero-D-manno-heptose 1,7-bisphosphate phosphatase